MWIVTTNGFISLVQDRHDPNLLQVRARAADDITAHFPDAEIIIAEGGDYRYRARIDRQQVAKVLAQMIRDIDYDSHFKDIALAKGGHDPVRHKAYYGVWGALADLQDYAPYSQIPRARR